MALSIKIENKLTGRTTAPSEVQDYKQMVLANGSIVVSATWVAVDVVCFGAHCVQHNIPVTTPSTTLQPGQSTTLSYSDTNHPGGDPPLNNTSVTLNVTVHAPGNDMSTVSNAALQVAPNVGSGVSVEYMIVSAQNEAWFAATYVPAGKSASVQSQLGTAPTQTTH